MSAPLKIFSLLIRGLDAELRARAVKEGKHIPEDEDDEDDDPKYLHHDDEQEVYLETQQDDSDDSGHGVDYNGKYGDKIQVDIFPVGHDDDYEPMDIDKKFNVRVSQQIEL